MRRAEGDWGIVAIGSFDGEITQHSTIENGNSSEGEVAMRTGPRCSECQTEDPKIISLQSPAGERYCGRLCLEEGRQQFIRWVRRSNAEAAS